MLFASTKRETIPGITVKVRTEAKHFPWRTQKDKRNGLGWKRERTEGNVHDEQFQDSVLNIHWHAFCTRLFAVNCEMCWLSNTCMQDVI